LTAALPDGGYSGEVLWAERARALRQVVSLGDECRRYANLGSTPAASRSARASSPQAVAVRTISGREVGYSRQVFAMVWSSDQHR
jgi:hypothetical protein